MSDPRALRVAMIGAGFMGKVHSAAYGLIPRFSQHDVEIEPVVLVDVDHAIAERSADAFGFPEHATDWREAIARDDVDAIDIVAPNDAHLEVAIAAAMAGKHVLCEKPLGRTLAEAEQMVKAIEAAGVSGGVAFNYRQTPGLQLARELVADLGQLFHFRGSYLQDWPVDPDSPWTWRFSRDLAGSGALGDIGSHLIDYAQYVVGPIRRVSALTRTFVGERTTPDGERKPVDVDDAAAFLAEFDNGTVGVLEATRFASGRKNKLSFEVDGSGGAVRFSWDQRDVVWYHDARLPARVAGFRAIECGPASPLGAEFWPIAGIGHGFLEAAVVLVREFALACRGEASATVSFREALGVERVIDAVLRSSVDGTWVETGVEAAR